MPARTITARLIDAVEKRDLEAVTWCFDADASWSNMPGPPVQGRQAIRSMFEWILPRCERVHWEIVSESYGKDTAWLERVDRFWIAGREYAIECNGVFRVDARLGLITEVRDYMDLGVWRARLAEGGITR